MRNLLTPLLYICVGALLSTMLMRSCNQKQIPTEIIKTDTLTIVKVDTIRIEKPVPYKVVVRDTVVVNSFQNSQDWKVLAQEVKEYQDSTYYAKISGINAFLEEIRVYPKIATKYITTTEYVREKQKKWGFGPQVGVGVVDNRIHTYIGFGIHYNIIQPCTRSSVKWSALRA